MSDSIEDLLQSLKAEITGQTPTPTGEAKNDPVQNSQGNLHQSLNLGLDRLNTELDFSQKKDLLDNLLNQVQQEITQQPTQYSSPAPSISYSSQTNPLLEELQADIEKEKQLKLAQERQFKLEQEQYQEQLEKQQQQLEIQRQKEAQLQKEKEKQQLRKEAETWLKKLNRRSEEGRWFQEFAEGYDSELDASIDYISALKRTGAI